MKTKDKILETALKLFNTRGYGIVGAREIARLLNISPGNLSYYFAKKEDIKFHLLLEFQGINSKLYFDYQQSDPTLEGFLVLMKGIFHNQYHFRGAYIGNHFVKMDIRATNQLKDIQDSNEILENFQIIFTNLAAQNQIKVNDSDIEFLVSIMSLFGRYWIQDAFLLQAQYDEEKLIRHYLKILKKQLSMFATKKGKKSIKKFSLKNFIA